MKEQIVSLINQSLETKRKVLDDDQLLSAIEKAAVLIKKVVAQGGTVYLCGNGGSACDAMHFSEELVARFKRERDGIKAMHFMDPGMLTCWANDYNFETAFQRSVQTFCGEKDLLVAFSTSGNSKNILLAVEAAKSKGTCTLGMTGKDGGALAGAADLAVVVPSLATERIQEVHIMLVHIFCELLER